MTDLRRILVTGPLLGDGINRLSQVAEVEYHSGEVMFQADFERAISRTWGVVCMTRLKITPAMIDAAAALKIISNLGVGYDNVDVSYAKQKRIVVTNTPDVLTNATADMGMALILAAARNVIAGDHLMRSGKFTGWMVDLLLGRDLHAKTLGIIGCGRIGQAVARRAHGFDMRVIYHNRRSLSKDVENALRLSYVEIDEMLTHADFIVITAPLNAQTYHLFNRDAFIRMKRSAYLINISRGGVINQADLIAALNDKLIAGAALDVLESPPGLTRDLIESPAITLTPHLGSATHEARVAMCDLAVQAILDLLDGRQPTNAITHNRQ